MRIKKTNPLREKFLTAVKDYGLPIKSPNQVGIFSLDLTFPEVKLAVEIIPNDHQPSARDIYREKELEKLNWKIEKFEGWFIYRYANVAVAKIALRYFQSDLTPVQEKRALGAVANFFVSRDPEFSVNLTELFLAK